MDITEMRETATALLAFGSRGTLPVVLKLSRPAKNHCDAGAVVQAFGGRGMVRAYERRDGAVLLERLLPGTPLTAVTAAGEDDRATAILADLIPRLDAPDVPAGCPTVEQWGLAFAGYLAGDDTRIPRPLVEEGQAWYDSLARSQRQRRLLHGDLHHSNVLLDSHRGWVAIDPKGVLGEMEYELGASLRNPAPAFQTPQRLERRLAIYGARLPIVIDRALGWAYAQAVLSVVWEFEDGTLTPDNPTLRFASAIATMLPNTP